MKHRKQTQHIRRYRSGRWTCVNMGVIYKRRSYVGWSTKPGKVLEFLDKTRWASGETAPSNLRKMHVYTIKFKLMNEFGFDEDDPRFKGLTKEELVTLYRDTFLEELGKLK